MEIQVAAPSLEEDRETAVLASSSRGWQARIAQRLARDARRSAGRPEIWVWSDLFSWQRWASAAAVAAMLVVAFLGVNYYQNPVRVSTRLLARSYTAGRQFEWRLPDAGWAQPQIRRSASVARSASLLEAEALLTRDQSAHENDPQWLELQARADMLDLRYEDAISRLQRALQLSPKSPDILTDLAVAHGLDADSGHPEEFAAVVEYTTQALEIDRQHRRALFNRAIAFERLNMVDRAIADWEQYLQIEKDPAWLKEAHDQIEKLREIQRKRVQLQESDDRSDAVLESKALNWLKSDRTKARGAGKFLFADYGDRWLADAAEEPVNSEPLLKAAQSVIGGRGDAPELSEAAVRFYALHPAPAHLARAQLEAVNALNRKEHADECKMRAHKLVDEAEARSYRSIQVQALLQENGCSSMLGKLGESDEERSRAIALARGFNLAGLEARAIGLDVSHRTANGDFWAAWRENRDMLARMAASPYSAVRIQQGLYNYSSSAELWGWRAASFEFIQAAADVIHNTHQLTEASNRARSAALAFAAHMDREYSEESRKAQELFHSLPDSETRTRDLYSIRLLEGEADLRAERPTDAVLVLRSAVQSVVVQREQWRAHELFGLGLLRTGAPQAAMDELQTAAVILNRRISTLRHAYERSKARREGVEAYRTLAGMLLEGEPTGAEALKVWLSANGSSDAPDVVFLALDNGYAVWTGRGAHLHRLQLDRARVRRAISEFLAAAGDPKQPTAKIRIEGHSLYDQLLRPLTDLPTSGVLTILPDEEIAAIPFSLLTDAQGKWLDESHATLLSALPEKRTDIGDSFQQVLVVGAPATHESLPALPESKREAESVASRFAGSKTVTGTYATLGAVTAGLEHSGLFHFSGHGYAGPTVGGLYLADSLLTSVSLQGLSLGSCRLAVLSACLTAKGQTDGLTNPDSLVHALLDAGVQTVIASRWDVDSAATAEWMERFYSGLAASGDPVQALQQASRSLRAERRYEHPYYWAAFQTYQ
jgi:CHAT domain-containing protein